MNTKKSIGSLVVASALSVALCGVALAREGAARILRVEGDVLVTSGTQSINAVEGRSLKIGDRLIALEGGQALLQFSDGCSYRLEDSQILTLTDLSPCARGLTSKTDSGGGHIGGAASAGAEIGLAWIPPALGGLTALGAVASNASDDDDDDDDDTFFAPPSEDEGPLPPISQ